MSETWRPVVGFEGLYEVSDQGQVRNMSGLILKQLINSPEGQPPRLQVMLSRDGKQYSRRTHRLVAEAFIPNPDSKPECDHIDRDALNNAVANLRWVGRAENSWNQGVRKNNTSGFRGVSWCKEKKRWCARIRASGKKVSLGAFLTAEEASAAYEAKAVELRGEYNPLS